MFAIDLFAGAGGFSVGLARAGFCVVLANEISVDPEWTYRFNLLHGTAEGSFPTEPSLATFAALREHRLRVREQIISDRVRHFNDLGRVMRGGDIAVAMPDEWLDRWLRHLGHEVDVLVAGPPCQGFSSAGKRDMADARNSLVHEALRVVAKVRPKVVVIENVPGMLQRHADIVRTVGLNLSRLPGRGPSYLVTTELVHSHLLGVPQTRKRLLVVGIREDLVASDLHEMLHALVFPPACPASPPDREGQRIKMLQQGDRLTASAILGDLEADPPRYGSPEARDQKYLEARPTNEFRKEMRTPRERYLGYSESRSADILSDSYRNHEGSVHSSVVARRMRLLREAAQSSEDARHNRCSSGWLRRHWETHDPEVRFTEKASQRVLLPDCWPMLTVTSLPDDIVHFSADRILTVRELARLQTFPDWFEFKGVRTTGAERRRAGIFVPQYTQVANAVPPRLAFAVAVRIRALLEQAESVQGLSENMPGGLYRTPNSGAHLAQLEALNRAFLLARRSSAKAGVSR